MARITITPEEYAEKHARRLKGATEDIRRGVNAVTEAPGKKAAEKADKYLAGIQEAVQSGKWQSRVSAVTLDEWKDRMLNVGVNRIAQGVDASRDKVQKFAEQLLAYQQNLQSEIERMPDVTLEDSINRMVTWVRGMSQFNYKR